MERAMEKRRFMLELRLSVLRYVLVSAFLVFVNWTVTPHYWWVLWVIAGWGLGLGIGLMNKYVEVKLNDQSNDSTLD